MENNSVEIAPLPYYKPKPVPYCIEPTSFEEAMRISGILAKSSFVPAHLKGKPDEIFLTIQFGQELGLKTLQSLQNIAVINGKPSVWGTAMVAIVRAHPEFESMIETTLKPEGLPKQWGVQCTIKRRNQPPHTSIFTVEDAITAKLWGKAGPWTLYPKRMLTWRARTMACNDVFGDALKGFISAEEAHDYPVVGSDSTYIASTEVSDPENLDFSFGGDGEMPELQLDHSYNPKTGEIIEEDTENG